MLQPFDTTTYLYTTVIPTGYIYTNWLYLYSMLQPFDTTEHLYHPVTLTGYTCTCTYTAVLYFSSLFVMHYTCSYVLVI